MSYSSKKQNTIALSSTETKHVSTNSCFAQILWMKYQIEDYSIRLQNILIKYDNTSVITLIKNLVFHARTNHIEVKY